MAKQGKAVGCAVIAVAWVVGFGLWSTCGDQRSTLIDGDDLQLESPKPGAKDLTLVLIFDTSGSMGAEVQGAKRSRLEIAKEVLLDDFVPILDDKAWLALVIFDGKRGKVLLEPRPAELRVEPKWTQRERIMEAIETARADAYTPIWASLTGTREELLKDVAGRRVVVLITDGVESVRSEDDVVEAIDENDKAGIETYAIGFELGSEGRYLQDRLGLGKRYFQANRGREGLIAALQSVLAAIEQ